MRSRTSKSSLTVGRALGAAFGSIWLLALASCGGSGTSYAPAQIDLVTPDRGPSTGGTMLRITGSNFAEGDIVTVGGQLAPGSVVVSPTEIAVPLPANPGVFGRAPISVTHRDEQTTSRSDLFSYYLGNLQLANRAVSTGAGRPYSVRIADLNADGVPDAITGNIGDGKLSVLLGVSGGGFLPPRNFVAGQQPVDIAVADINADGKLDVAIADFAARRINVLLGDGQGGFPSGYGSAVSGAPLSLAVGDV